MAKLNWFKLLLLCLACYSAQVFAFSCKSTGYHSQVKVKKVLDADLIELVSGQVVRLNGVQAPLRNRTAEPDTLKIASQSAKQLEAILAHHNQLYLVLDKALLDQDNHMLAHLFLADGRNVQNLLLQQGAVQLDIQAPNSMFWKCYYHAQLTAMKTQMGVWAHADFQAKPAEQARYTSSVNQNWLGRVIRVFEQHQATWLVLNDWLYVEVPDAVQKRYFKQLDLHQLTGHNIIVNSRIGYKNNRWQALVSQPWEFINLSSEDESAKP